MNRGRPKKDDTVSKVFSVRFCSEDCDKLYYISNRKKMSISDTFKFCIREIFNEEVKK